MTYQQAAQLARVRWRQAAVRCPDELNPWTLMKEVQRFYCVQDVTVYDALGEKVLAVSRAPTAADLIGHNHYIPSNMVDALDDDDDRPY